MDSTSKIDEWSAEFTREEILKQHVHLIEEENRLLQDELSRYRKNMPKLVDMHNDVTVVRDKLRAELK